MRSSPSRLEEGLGVALEPGGHRVGQGLRRGALDGVHRVAERNARPQVEGEVDRGELAGVVHRERTDGPPDAGDGLERDELPGRGAHVNGPERARVEAELGHELGEHVVLVVGRVDGGDAPGPEGGVEGVLHGERRHACREGAIPVDLHAEARCRKPQVAVDLDDLGEVAHARLEPRGRREERGGVGVLEGEGVLGSAPSAGEGDGGRDHHECPEAGHRREIATQIRRDPVHVWARAVA
jgi:hypothetical protein